MSIKIKSATAGMALLMGLASLATAQPMHDRPGDRDGHGAPPHMAPGRPGHDFDARPRDRGPGIGPSAGFYRGDRLPREYRDRQYVITHWRDHRLSAPPRGYQWVQVGADYALVAIATGVIAQIILSSGR